jgi:hypothetical protein
VTPTDKVAAGGAASLAAVVLAWVAGELGVDMPAEVAAAFTGLLAFAAGWFKRETRPAR